MDYQRIIKLNYETDLEDKKCNKEGIVHPCVLRIRSSANFSF